MLALTALMVGHAHAEVIPYQFSGIHNNEQTMDLSSNAPLISEAVSESDFLFAADSTISAQFFYDIGNTIRWQENLDMGSTLGPASLWVYTSSAIGGDAGNTTAMTVTFGSTTLAARNQYVLIADAATGSTAYDMFSSNLLPDAFHLGDYSLIGMQMVIIGNNDWLPSQDLPGELSGGLQAIVGLNFSNSSQQRDVYFYGTLEPVPLPASGLLFGASLGGLAFRARQKLMKKASEKARVAR